ncbi:hypothetical protein CS078_01570 [Pseudomonas prosekii]|uniref:Uncharacterized protein n=1 Tax=Pseudomonas prosekii TaxID=1148509 RepID=A0A3L8CVX7_9PSED|nr:hypothetical protein CS078_01570 [Pseudomonas prosekii]
MHSCHLEGLPLKIKGLAGKIPANATIMAISHHELSGENAVIPFSLSQPKRQSLAGPVTFEMEHFHR